MRKSLKAWMILLLLPILGCATQPATPAVTPSPATPAQSKAAAPTPVKPLNINIKIGVGAVGGGWYAIGEGIAESVRREYPGANTSTSPTDKVSSNPVRAQERQVDFAMGPAPTVLDAIKGLPPYDKSPTKDLRGVIALFSEPFYFIVKSDTGLTNIADIKAKKYPLRISVNAKGSFYEVASAAILEAHGISYADIESWGGKILYLNTAQTLTMLQDGNAHGIISGSPHPAAPIMQMASLMKMTSLDIGAEAIKKINQKFGTVEATLAKDAYTFMTGNQTTFADTNILVTHKDTDPNLVYALVRAMDHNREYLGSVNKAVKTDFTPEFMIKVGGVPLHPGAERYYKEIGVIK